MRSSSIQTPSSTTFQPSLDSPTVPATTSTAENLGQRLLEKTALSLKFLTQVCSLGLTRTKPNLNKVLTRWVNNLPSEEQTHAQHVRTTLLNLSPETSTIDISWAQPSPLPDISPFFKRTEELHIFIWSGPTPTWISNFPNLKKLSITSPYMETLPSNIENLSTLRTLKLKDCRRLHALPDSILKLQQLRALSLIQCGELRQLPADLGQLRKLRKLHLSQCYHLESLPESFGQLQQLTQLYVNRCRRLTSLPESLLNLNGNCAIYLNGNGLSPHVLETLQQRVQNLAQQGGRPVPRIEYALDYTAGTGHVEALNIELEKWRAEEETHTPLSQHETSSLNALPLQESQALATLLHRLRKTAIYCQQPQATVQRVNAFMAQALQSPNLLEACCVMALESTETCDDRTALGLVLIELLTLEHDLLNQAKLAKAPEEAYSLLKQQAPSIFKLRHLLNIAHEHAQHVRGMVDETEIVLKYLTNLGQEFKLPAQIDHMLFSEHGWQVDQRALSQAREKLNNISDTEFVSLWMQWPVYRDTVEHQQPKVYQHIQQEQQRIDLIFQNQLGDLQNAFQRSVNTVGEYDQKTLEINIDINKLTEERKKAMDQPWRQQIANTLKYSLDE